jgi:hypothetical protein
MIKPGNVTCAGLVAIMMVLPSSLWKSNSARANAGPARGSRDWDPRVRVISVPRRGSADNGAPNNRKKGRGDYRRSRNGSTYVNGATPTMLPRPSVRRSEVPHGSVNVALKTPNSGSFP